MGVFIFSDKFDIDVRNAFALAQFYLVWLWLFTFFCQYFLLGQNEDQHLFVLFDLLLCS